MSALKRAWEFFFGSVDFRKSVFLPVVVNLTTAFSLFLFVSIFRDTIYEHLRPKPRVESFPIYCVAEGYNNENGEVIAEIFIINRTQDSYDQTKLVDFLKRISPEQEKNFDPAIRIKWIATQAEVSVAEDGQFNLNKGKLRILPPSEGGGDWTIRIENIADRAILKVLVTTNLRRPLDRASRLSLPFKIDYRGE